MGSEVIELTRFQRAFAGSFSFMALKNPGVPVTATRIFCIPAAKTAPENSPCYKADPGCGRMLTPEASLTPQVCPRYSKNLSGLNTS
jgi:hypothetical protein